ncbi:Phytosulfokine receptor 1 [Camellia lanceoleosa]|nr:Phytosulfokine receptor 1 [Camellia lanceoleosa]
MGVLELWVIFTFTLVFSLRVQVSNSQNITFNSNDLQALEAFLIGLDLGTINGWGTSNCCNWSGITCNSSSSLSFFNDPIDSCRVVKLELLGKILVANSRNFFQLG